MSGDDYIVGPLEGGPQAESTVSDAVSTGIFVLTDVVVSNQCFEKSLDDSWAEV
jgi:hypothetical protein